MEITNNFQTIPWLRPMVELINQRQYEEAFELGEYLPATTERKLVQCVALVRLKKFTESETLLMEFSPDIPKAAPFLSTLFPERAKYLMTITLHAIDEECLLTGHLFFESYLCRRPIPGKKALIAMKGLAGIALKSEKYHLGKNFIDRALAIDNSPDQLLKCAKVVLINRTSQFAQNLLDFSKSLIDQAIDKLEDNDIGLRIEAVKLLAIDIKTFDVARSLIREVLKFDLSKKKEISNLLLPLIDFKPYFSEIADLLIEIDPANISLVVDKLNDLFEIDNNSDYLEKAKKLVGRIDFIDTGYVKQFADALLVLAAYVEDFELIAERIFDKDVNANVFLKFAEKLIELETNDLMLTSKLMEKALLLDSSLRLYGIQPYVSLSNLCKKKGKTHLKDAFIVKSVRLSSNLVEFLEHGFDSPLERIKAVFEYEEILTEGSWVKKDEKLYLALKIIEESRSISSPEKEKIMVIFNEHFKEVPTEELEKVERTLKKKEGNFKEYMIQNMEMDEHYSYCEWDLLIHPDEPCLEPSDVLSGALDDEKFPFERYTRIEFPAKCELEKKVELKIQLMKNKPVLTRVLEKISVEVEKGIKVIIIDVHVTAPGFAIQQKSKSMMLPVDSDSEELIFSLYPAESGTQAIEIEFFYKSSRVGYVIVRTYVSGWESSGTISDVITMEDPLDNLPREDFANINRRTIHVSWEPREEKMYYKIYSVNQDGCSEGVQESPGIKNDIENYLCELNGFLTEIVNRANPLEKDWDSINLNMKGYGKNLFEKLLPQTVVEHARKWDKGSTVIISTNEQWVPWELLHDSNDFWGKKFILARYPRLSDCGKIPDKSRKISTSSYSINGIINVVGGDIPKTETEKAISLFSPFSLLVPVKVLEQEPVSILEKSLAQANTLHCTCHGRLNPPMLQVAKDKSRYNNLLIDTVNALTLSPGCFVFANACSSSAPVIKFGKFSNFGWEFYRCGADIFIGTLGAVPAKYAIQFAESVYKELFSTGSRPQTIGQAISNAKKEAENNRNLFWLLYTLYGNPDICLKIK